MRLAFVNVKYATPKTDPFFRAADNKSWMLEIGGKVYGPFNTRDECTHALQSDILTMHGIW